MWYDDRAASPDLSYKVALLMSHMREINAESTIRAAANVLMPGVVQTLYFPKVPFFSAQMFIRWNDVLLILIDGVTSETQVATYRLGLGQRTDFTNVEGANSGVVATAILLQTRLGQMTGGPTNRTIIVGHSMGGAVAQVLSYLCQRNAGFGDISCITFGSPRPGPEEFATAIRNLDLQRWMCIMDPVPCIPPRPNQCPIFFIFMTREGILNTNRHVQAHGGATLNDVASTMPADVPPAVVPNVQMNLASWLVSMATMQPSEHSLATYITRLSLLRDRVQPPSRPSTHTNHSEEYVAPTVRENRHFVLEGIDQLIEADAQREYGAVVIPQGQAFVAKKIGQVWVSQFRGNTISVGPTRRRARSFCARANVFLNKLQIQGKVDPESFLAAMTTYLADAADPMSAFVPTMNT